MDVATFKEHNRAMGGRRLRPRSGAHLGRRAPARRANGHPAGEDVRTSRAAPATLRSRPPSRAPGSSASISRPSSSSSRAPVPPAPASRSTGWKETPKPSRSTTRALTSSSRRSAACSHRANELAAREIARVLRPGGAARDRAVGRPRASSATSSGRSSSTSRRRRRSPRPQSCGAILNTCARSFSAPASSSSSSTTRWTASTRCRTPSTYETNFGPLVKARELLEPEGRRQAAHRDLVALYEEHVEACSRELAFSGEYLVALGGRRSRRATLHQA